MHIIEVVPYLEVREDGMIRNTNPSVRNNRGNKDWNPGVKTSYGYFGVQLPFTNKSRLVHRLLATAFIPNPNNLKLIDHIDGDKTNNNVSNLRWCTHRQNSSNQEVHRNGKLVGTCYDELNKKWIAKIRIEKKVTFLGRFETEQEAHLKYIEKLKEIEKLIT